MLSMITENTRLLLALALLLPALSASAQIKEAEDLVEQTTAEMLALIEEAKVYVDEDPERFYVAVEALLNPVIEQSAKSAPAGQLEAPDGSVEDTPPEALANEAGEDRDAVAQ